MCLRNAAILKRWGMTVDYAILHATQFGACLMSVPHAAHLPMHRLVKRQLRSHMARV